MDRNRIGDSFFQQVENTNQTANKGYTEDETEQHRTYSLIVLTFLRILVDAGSAMDDDFAFRFPMIQLRCGASRLSYCRSKAGAEQPLVEDDMLEGTFGYRPVGVK